MSRISQYEAFVATIDTGSLAKAAKSLNLSPSAISKQLSTLELDLGVTLLERRNRMMDISPAGQDFYQRCKKILADIDDAESEVVTSRDEMAGGIRLSMANTLTRSVLPNLISKFSRKFPQLRFQIRATDDLEDLVTGRIDFAFRIGKLADNRLHAIPLVDTRPVFCASPDYVNHYGLPKNIVDLKDHQLMLPTTLNLSTVVRKLFDDEEQLAKLHIANDYNLIYSLTLQGLCVTAMLNLTVQQDIKQGTLIHLFPQHSIQGKKLYLVYAKQGVLPKKLRLFKEFMKESWI